MLRRFIPYIIISQFIVWFFNLWIGYDEYLSTGIFYIDSLFILVLSFGTYLVFSRIQTIPANQRSLCIVFEHAVILWILVWFFYKPWPVGWEMIILIFLIISMILAILLRIIESQYNISLTLNNIWFFKWVFNALDISIMRLFALLFFINTITIPLFLILFHHNLAYIWIIYWFSWLFLWKNDL